jgi:hypothetical protein
MLTVTWPNFDQQFPNFGALSMGEQERRCLYVPPWLLLPPPYCPLTTLSGGGSAGLQGLRRNFFFRPSQYCGRLPAELSFSPQLGRASCLCLCPPPWPLLPQTTLSVAPLTSTGPSTAPNCPLTPLPQHHRSLLTSRDRSAGSAWLRSFRSQGGSGVICRRAGRMKKKRKSRKMLLFPLPLSP